MFEKLFELSNQPITRSDNQTCADSKQITQEWPRVVRWAPNVFVSPIHLIHSHQIFVRWIHPQTKAPIHRNMGLMPLPNTHAHIFIVDSLYYTRFDHTILPLALCMCANDIVYGLRMYSSVRCCINVWKRQSINEIGEIFELAQFFKFQTKNWCTSFLLEFLFYLL